MKSFESKKKKKNTFKVKNVILKVSLVSKKIYKSRNDTVISYNEIFVTLRDYEKEISPN